MVGGGTLILFVAELLLFPLLCLALFDAILTFDVLPLEVTFWALWFDGVAANGGCSSIRISFDMNRFTGG